MGGSLATRPSSRPAICAVGVAHDLSQVVPAKAGTHTPCRWKLVKALISLTSRHQHRFDPDWRVGTITTHARGYGSPPSRGRLWNRGKVAPNIGFDCQTARRNRRQCVWIRLRDLAARCARGLVRVIALSWKRARGTPDARCVRSLMRKVKSARVSHHESTGDIRRSARGGLPACFVLSPATVET